MFEMDPRENFLQQALAIGTQIIEPKNKSVAPGPEELFDSSDEAFKPHHRRRPSSSSMGSIPLDTDFDFDDHHGDDEADEDGEEEEIEFLFNEEGLPLEKNIVPGKEGDKK
ncbi:hypothetical protein B0H14DRAFT_2586596 [Mycena olivaceomarginata]|nr:hypothetical protein B0H14DRAFT_2586596 [Mycena olivaceomarginata]